MRANFGLMCIVACGVTAGVWLWRDRSPAGRPAQPSTPAEAGPAGPDRTVASTHPAPRPTLAHAAEAHGPQPVTETAPGTPASGAEVAEAADVGMMRALVRKSLVHDLPRKLPELKLSDADLDRLTDTMLRVREHNLRVRSLAQTPDNAAEIRRLEERLVHDLQVFEEVTGMSATELTGALSDEGVTTEEQAHATKPVYWTIPE